MTHLIQRTLPNITEQNLQELCRTCLTTLSVADTTADNSAAMAAVAGMGSVMSYNVLAMPHLRKLMVLFTSVDMTEDSVSGEIYPKMVCRVCFYKLLDIDEFRRTALHSAQVLWQAAQQRSKGTTVSGNDRLMDKAPLLAAAKEQAQSERQGGDNDQKDPLLLEPLTIKDELIDIDEPRMQSPPTDSAQGSAAPTNSLLFEGATVVSIPTQIMDKVQPTTPGYDSNNDNGGACFTPQKPPEDATAKPTPIRFYPKEEELSRSSYAESLDNDADDEECALRNGAANNSSQTSRAQHGNNNNNYNHIDGANTNAMKKERKRERKNKCLKCPRCDKQAYKQVYLDAHIRAVHEGHQKPFLCPECQKDFTRYHQLHVHIKSNHMLKQQFVCEFNGCNATFHVSNKLDTHRRVKHASEGDSISIGVHLSVQQSLLSDSNDCKHFCQECRKEYSSKRALSEHLKRHAKIKDHVCKVCGAAKVTRFELQTHMRVHQTSLEKFPCPVCPKVFNHKNAISRHVRVVHEGQRRFPCRFCAKRFGTRNSQVSHERLHTGERPFACQLCGRTFAQVESLKSHMKSHDKSLRTFVCSVCSLRFITRRNLADHEERHRGSKPHICASCSRGFASIEDLQAHQHSHREEDEETAEASQRQRLELECDGNDEQSFDDEDVSDDALADEPQPGYVTS